MILVYFIVIALLSTCHADEEDTNEISPRLPSINLDANLRRALLRALTELENEEQQKSQQNASQQTILDDKIFEKAHASAISFFASTTAKPVTTTTSTTTSEQPVVIVQKSHGIQQKPIISLEDTEQIQTSASGSFTNKLPTLKSLSSPATANSVSVTEKPTTTPVSITTSIEENEAKVEDVQFFTAPLVAAFTLHQDERGIPKSVIPLYKTEISTENTKKIEEEMKQAAVKDFEKTHKALEEQHFKLQQQNLLKQQQLFHQQQLELQRQHFLEEQARLEKNQVINRGALVSLQPSISFHPTEIPFTATLPVLTNQQLPIKNPVDFNKYSFVNSPDYIPFAAVLHPPTEFPPVNFQTHQHNRIFRHEGGVRNFGSNFQVPQQSHQTRFFRNNLEATQTNPFIVRPPIVNQQLNNLLYSSGIVRGQPQEDLSIVSKVLSFNHLGGGDDFFGGLAVRQKRVPTALKSV